MSLYHKMTSGWNQSDKVAIVFDNREWTFGDIEQHVSKICSFFEKKGCQKGDLIGIQLSKQPLMLEIILAALRMGLGVVPLNDSYTSTEIALYVQDAKVRFVISEISYDGILCIEIDEIYRYINKQIPDFQHKKYDVFDDDLAVLLYTSGTTGKPKGAFLTHKNLWTNIEGLHQAWCWSEDDILLHMLPLFHVHGLFVAAFGALRAQATIILEKHFDTQRFFSCIPQYSCSIFMGVPTMYHRILSTEQDAVDFSTMRLFTSGSAPMAVDIHKKFHQKFGQQIVERYGMSEVGIVLSNPYIGEKRIGSVGFPICEIQCRIVDQQGQDVQIGEIGELLHSGPSVISKYFCRPEETSQSITNGWFYSGDLAYQDRDGYFYIVGRSKDLIISGGFNVYPREIETIIREIDGVQDVAVIGVPNPEWGETVVAILICDAGELPEEKIRTHVAQNCTKYKRPRHYFYVSEFPRNAMGKVQKAKLRVQFASLVENMR